MSNNLRRIVTALLAAPVVLGLAYLGSWWFAGLVAGIGLLGQRELYRMARQGGAWPQGVWGGVVGGLLVVTFLRPALWPVGAAVLLLFVVAAPLLVSQEQFLFSFTVTLAGAVYPTGLLGSLIWLREARSATVGDEEAFWLVVFVLVVVWATDVAAYYVGKTVGRRPLAPSISPNKTWEGTLGGLGAALIVGLVLKLTVVDLLAWTHVVALIGIGGGVSQLGDLLESKLKRSVAVDDSSQLLPGHGGMLDRFDAMAVAAPLSVLYLHLVAGLV
ncbi:phosphatidate cytidylyltransferase [Salinibacter altiplanensis]|uniref:phosphatidate cytidylyltransferase n=1 Tax=Salinibacter altiplanensis TaxID=1803181 RepID=UPI000C9FB712|nr:phosphatidate cytidylyltransferase [Salinibacter altiplanensis]